MSACNHDNYTLGQGTPQCMDCGHVAPNYWKDEVWKAMGRAPLDEENPLGQMAVETAALQSAMLAPLAEQLMESQSIRPEDFRPGDVVFMRHSGYHYEITVKAEVGPGGFSQRYDEFMTPIDPESGSSRIISVNLFGPPSAWVLHQREPCQHPNWDARARLGVSDGRAMYRCADCGHEWTGDRP